jgi:TonB family protein
MLLAVGGLRGEQAAQRIGPGIKPPRLVYKIEPEYTPEARDEGVQATVAFEIVVSEQGKATNITVLSPAGYGLDERAESAIRQWVFEPGQKEGRPVPILATVEVNFRLSDLPFNQKTEQRRTEFNVALARLSCEKEKLAAMALKTIQEMAKQNFAPAIYQMGSLYCTGKLVPRDPARGTMLIADAAKRKYGPAMYELGMQLLTGQPELRNPQKGLDMLRGAAERGSRAAQFELGERYEKGEGVKSDATKAMRYFRLCAAAGEYICQYRLASHLIAQSVDGQSKWIEAIAWLELAAGQGYIKAQQMLAPERQKLTPGQMNNVNGLKKMLVHK